MCRRVYTVPRTLPIGLFPGIVSPDHGVIWSKLHPLRLSRLSGEQAHVLENLEEVALYSRAIEEITFTTLRRREASVMLATLNRTEYGSSRSDPGK